VPARDEWFDIEIVARQHADVVQCARHNRRNDDLIDIASVNPVDLQELHQPHGIFVTGSPRIGCDAPTRLDLAPIEQGEDNIRIPGIDC